MSRVPQRQCVIDRKSDESGWIPGTVMRRESDLVKTSCTGHESDVTSERSYNGGNSLEGTGKRDFNVEEGGWRGKRMGRKYNTFTFLLYSS